jgi:omega-6 fatty acid desaturase (delta-12 desaturase)
LDKCLNIDPLQFSVAPDLSKDNVARFQAASLWRARWQVINSFVPYVLLWFAMDRALVVSYWLMLPIGILAAGFLARIFIIFHDCGHSSFFKSKRANNATGTIAGLLNLMPYRHWRWQHALHHGTAGDLDRRGSGDIWTLTVLEYLQSTRWRRFAYRLARNPIVLFVIAPLYVFVVHHRFAVSSAPRRERQSVHRTNWALLGITLVMSAVIGFIDSAHRVRLRGRPRFVAILRAASVRGRLLGPLRGLELHGRSAARQFVL